MTGAPAGRVSRRVPRRHFHGLANSLAVHLNGITVDHRGDAAHVGQGRGGEQAKGDGESAHGV
ncbi:MAG: hypothetical protein IIA72_23870 [Proteobacteria bacterium]|nr:hypothetical protein [Pseudomonadota bacterium]